MTSSHMTDEPAGARVLERRLERFRALRRELEAAVLPLAVATFGLGEALVAGKISPHPALIRFGARVAEEGGSDVPSTWAAVRPGPGGSS